MKNFHPLKIVKIFLVLISLILNTITSFSQASRDTFGVIVASNFHSTRPLSEIFKPISNEEKKNENVVAEKKESGDQKGRKAQLFPFAKEGDLVYGNDVTGIQKEMGTVPPLPLKASWIGQTGNARPFDPTGAVGPNNYIQIVNSTTFRIYDKTGVQQLSGILGDLWNPVTNNTGDPIVLYDKAANRWMMAQFGTGADKKVYIAISQTDNPLGSWYTYTFTSPEFPDYLKFSVWADAYYMTSNQHIQQRVFTFNRTELLSGISNAHCVFVNYSPPQFSTPSGNSFFCPLAADASDGILPPIGTPCPILSYSDNGWGAGFTDAIQIYSMSVNWSATPLPTASVSFTATLPTAAFDASYDSNWLDCPQPGTLQKLDGIGGVLMYRAQWKPWVNHNSIVLNWGVKINSTQRSIKWCELRQSQLTQTWSLYQEGIYAPDSDTRWMGSIAMNDAGVIGLSYLKSNATGIYPGLYYTGRKSCDPLGIMTTTETLVAAGTGSQFGFGDVRDKRVGDYAQTTIDPSDGLTFWSSSEYFGGTSGTNAARTRIFSYQIAPCIAEVTIAVANSSPNNCLGLSNVFTATPINGGNSPGFQWRVNGSNVAAYTATFSSINLQVGDIVTCIMTSDLPGVMGSPDTSNSIIVQGNPSPDVSPFASPASICIGGSSQLNANSGSAIAYSWSPSNGISNPASATPVATPTANTTYTVTVTNAANCTSSATVVLFVNPLPVINPNGQLEVTPSTICLGEYITLNHTLFTPQCLIQSDFKNAFAPISSYYGSSGSMYAGNVDLTSAPASITLITDDNPSWYNQNAMYNLLILCADTVTFHWTYTTTDSLSSSYPLYSNGAAVLTFPGFIPYGPKTQSGIASIPVWPGSPLTLTTSLSYSPFATTTIKIENLTGPFLDIYTVDWYDAPIGGNLIGSLNSSLNNNNPNTNFNYKPTTTGSNFYYAELVNPYTGCSSNRVATIPVTVHSTPVITLNANPSTICEGDTSQLNAIVTSASPITNYSWSPDYNLTNSLLSDPKAFPVLPTVYTLEVTDTNACKQTATQDVYVKPPPFLGTTTATPASLCEGSQVSLAYTAPNTLACNGVYQTGFAGAYSPAHWIKTQFNSYDTINTDNAPNTINFMPSGATGLVGGGYTNYTITVPCSGIISFDWVYNFGIPNTFLPRYSIDNNAFQNFPGFDTTVNLFPLNINSYQTGTLNVSIQEGQTFTIQIYSADFPPEVALDIINFKAPVQNIASQTVTWYDASNGGTNLGFGNPKNYVPPVAGTYTYYAQVSNGFTGCTNMSRVATNSVLVHPLPQLVISSVSDTICAGNSITLTASNAFSYLWSGGGNTNASVTVSPTSTTTYSVTGTSVSGCTKMVTKTMYVIVCDTSSTTTVTASGSYTWAVNGITYTQSGTYVYTTMNGAGNVVTNTLILTINYLTLEIDQEISCHGNNDGSCFAIVNPPSFYASFTLDNLQTNATGYFQNLTAGTHTICATNGSVTECSIITMIDPPPLIADVSITSSVTCQSSDGILLGTYAGGTYPYNIYWTNALGATIGFTSTLSNLAPGGYTFHVEDDHGCITMASTTLQPPVCNSILNIKCFIEGYYIGSNLMDGVLQHQGVAGASSVITDTIIVELRNSFSPYNIVSSAKAILYTNGTASFNFPVSGVYYLVVKHRNGTQTWSANPVSIGGISTNYDFTTAANKAFGNNMREVETGVWAFYSGDLNADENIDLLDLGHLETDISNFLYGYVASDINGDGNVDLLDSPVVENNLNAFIFSNHP